MTPTGAASFQSQERIGAGGYANVFKATGPSGQIVALKKSRVSVRVKRPLLQHEVRVLQLLQGHRAIAALYGYGRFEHFEFIAMELLGPALRELHKPPNKVPLRTVILVAQQMLSALEHIHNLDIMHRDIKPENILLCLNNPSQIRLIDFGLARRHLTVTPPKRDLFAERMHLVGTVNWASLNSHDGAELSFRDDLESLAFTLIFLLRGDLPWRGNLTEGETIMGSMARVREKKRAWPGSRLVQTHADAVQFGSLLDYARASAFKDRPNYSRLRSLFNKLFNYCGFEDDKPLEWTGETPITPPKAKVPNSPCIVRPGQLVSVEILVRTTIEGYSRHTGDDSFWHDPALSGDEWRLLPKPAIVVTTLLDNSTGYQIVRVVPLRQGRPTSAETKGVVPISIAPTSSSDLKTISPRPAWPLRDTYVYAYPVSQTFVCFPDQTQPIHAYWTVGRDDTKFLRYHFARCPPPFKTIHPSNHPDPDVRANGRLLERSSDTFYAKFTALQPETLEKTFGGATLDWMGERGRFDEIVKLSKWRTAENGWDWSVTGQPNNRTAGDFSDSYFDDDISLWLDRQQERDDSLTLKSGETLLLDDQIPHIAQVGRG